MECIQIKSIFWNLYEYRRMYMIVVEYLGMNMIVKKCPEMSRII